MTVPSHASVGIGGSLPADYFSPGTYTVCGIEYGSPWAEAYWAGATYRFQRAALGAPWIRTN
jgi:hypothetical protein